MTQVDRFLSDRRSAGAARHKTRKALGPILGYLRGLEMAPAAETPVEDGPAGEILNRYRQFLTTERGLVPVTALRYVDCLRPFLDRRMSADGLELGSLTPADVTSFVVAWCPRLNGGVAKLTVTALRSFLGFLHLDGVTERSLVSAVPTVCAPPAGRAAQGARARSGAAPSGGMRCPHARRLPRSGNSDPAGPARPAARRGRRAQARRYRLARGHDQRARQGQLSRTDAPSAGCRSPAGRIPAHTPGRRTPRAGPCSSGTSRPITRSARAA